MKYHYYVIKRIILLIPIFFGVSFITWLLADLGGNPLAAYVGEGAYFRMTREEINQLIIKLGLDQPWYVRFIKHISRFIQGDWGESPVYASAPVTTLISTRLQATIEIAVINWNTVRNIFGLKKRQKRRQFYSKCKQYFLLIPGFHYC